MSSRLRVCLIVPVLMAAVSASVSALEPDFVLVKQGEPEAAIVVGDKATRPERHAAEELVSYVRQISGATLSVTTESSPAAYGATRLVLIGRPETNGQVRALQVKGQLDLSAAHPGLDGFVIQTVGDRLVLGGSRDRGTLFAVYYLLEKYLKVGFFWDGEYVPASRDVALPAVHLVERPRFATRLSVSGGDCASTYSFVAKWGFEEHRRELDWLAKNRFNTACFGLGGFETNYGLGGRLVYKTVLEEMGVGPQQITDEDKAQADLAKRVYDYVRTLDMEVVTPLPANEVSPQFAKAHPEAKYYGGSWYVDENEGHKFLTYLYPDDPLYVRWIKTYIETWAATYGTWHRYRTDMPNEAKFKTSDDERRRINASFPSGILAGIKAADPQGVWHFSTWGWVCDEDGPFWTREVLQAFLEKIPPEKALIWDIWEARPLFKSERCNRFWGRDFAVGFIHQFGGADYLHGNFQKAIAYVHDAAKLDNCTGFGLFPEVLHYNPHYYDLITRLAWNPNAIEQSAYLDDMLLRRYGADGVKPMREAFQGLVETVYGPGGSADAPYQHRLYPGDVAAPPVERIRKLAGFLRAGLALPPAVRSRRLVENDLTDVFRQYAAEMFRRHLSLLEKAAAAKDVDEVQAEAKTLTAILDQVELVLSSRPDYRLEDIAKSLARTGSGPALEAIKAWIRDSGLTFAVSHPTITDYQSKDIYELNRFYYRPRVERYLALRLESLQAGTELSRKRLDAGYREIELAWCKQGYDPKDAPAYAGPTWRAVQEAFDRIDSKP